MNRLPGTILAIETSGSIALVDVDVDVDAVGLRLTATLVGAVAETSSWQAGMAVTLLFAETEVALAKNLSGLISMRNRICGTIVGLARGTVLARVILDIGGHQIVSIITTRASHALTLAVGDHVEALVKANEMSVVPAEEVVSDAGRIPGRGADADAGRDAGRDACGDPGRESVGNPRSGVGKGIA